MIFLWRGKGFEWAVGWRKTWRLYVRLRWREPGLRNGLCVELAYGYVVAGTDELTGQLVGEYSKAVGGWYRLPSWPTA